MKTVLLLLVLAAAPSIASKSGSLIYGLNYNSTTQRADYWYVDVDGKSPPTSFVTDVRVVWFGLKGILYYVTADGELHRNSWQGAVKDTVIDTGVGNPSLAIPCGNTYPAEQVFYSKEDSWYAYNFHTNKRNVIPGVNATAAFGVQCQTPSGAEGTHGPASAFQHAQ